MDTLFVLYSSIFIGILLSPFLYSKIYSQTSKDASNESQVRKRILLDNLRDLKAEMDTGKIEFIEFEELSKSIVSELDSIAPQEETKKNCNQCGYSFQSIEAKFCEICGTRI
jgi:hypothetical protein